jgi:ATP-dependent Lon protease
MTEAQSAPETLPILPNREAVVFPSMLFPMAIRNEQWVRAIDSVAAGHKTIAFFFQNEESEVVTRESLSTIGCSASIVRMLRVPDGSIQVLLQGLNRIRLDELT